MTDSSKVRLVRCPKCENLLQELVDYSVYQCGGCGAVLRAKGKYREGDILSDKSDEDGLPVQSQNSLDKGIVDLIDASDADVKPNADSLRRGRRDSKIDEVGYGERYGNPSNVTSDNWVTETGLDMSGNRDDLGEPMEGNK